MIALLQTTRNLQFWGGNRPPQKSTAEIRLQILFLHNLIGQQFGFTLVASEKRAESFGCNKKKRIRKKGADHPPDKTGTDAICKNRNCIERKCEGPPFFPPTIGRKRVKSETHAGWFWFRIHFFFVVSLYSTLTSSSSLLLLELGWLGRGGGRTGLLVCRFLSARCAQSSRVYLGLQFLS